MKKDTLFKVSFILFVCLGFILLTQLSHKTKTPVKIYY